MDVILNLFAKSMERCHILYRHIVGNGINIFRNTSEHEVVTDALQKGKIREGVNGILAVEFQVFVITLGPS